MKRRNFFKKIAGVIAGLVIAPFVIEAKETLQVGEMYHGLPSESKERHEQRKKLYKPITNWAEIHKQIVTNPNQFEFGAPKDGRMVLFTADGDAYESKDIILK